MRRLNVSEFRNTFSKLTEPVEILRGVDTLGFYYPAGFVPKETTETPIERTDFRPAPKPGKK